MREFVIFTLVAPMGAFGGPAGHERRGTDSWPARSAVLGLVGAALGVRREDTAGQKALTCWRMAVSVLSAGPVLRDFHTVQTVPAARIKRPATRADALAALNHSDNGLITCRDYRMDCAFGVALWGGVGADRLVSALSKPVFVPYLGRKSCPLSAPMAAQVVQAESPVQALAQIQPPPFMSLDPANPLLVASDEPDGGAGQLETFWDDPVDREKWHFAARQVYVFRPVKGGAP
ncbi:type I-E CRISPR-associated protein Cas5/CasD [Profundibacter sp.]